MIEHQAAVWPVLEQAVAHLHLALFDEGAALEDVDFQSSMPELIGPDVATKSILDSGA